MVEDSHSGLEGRWGGGGGGAEGGGGVWVRGRVAPVGLRTV